MGCIRGDARRIFLCASAYGLRVSSFGRVEKIYVILFPRDESLGLDMLGPAGPDTENPDPAKRKAGSGHPFQD